MDSLDATLDVLRENVYKYLLNKQHITCDVDTFRDSIDVYQTAHGVYIDIYAGASEATLDDMRNKLLSITPNDLANYKNVVDWWVQQHELVRYINELDAYIFITDSSVEYED